MATSGSRKSYQAVFVHGLSRLLTAGRTSGTKTVISFGPFPTKHLSTISLFPLFLSPSQHPPKAKRQRKRKGVQSVQHTSPHKIPIPLMQTMQKQMIPRIQHLAHLPKLRHPGPERSGELPQPVQKYPIDEDAREQRHDICPEDHRTFRHGPADPIAVQP